MEFDGIGSGSLPFYLSEIYCYLIKDILTNVLQKCLSGPPPCISF